MATIHVECPECSNLSQIMIRDEAAVPCKYCRFEQSAQNWYINSRVSKRWYDTYVSLNHVNVN